MTEKPDKKIDWKKTIQKLCVSILIIGLIVLGIYLLMRHFGLTDITQENLRAMIEKTGGWGAIVFILITFLQVTFIPIPSVVTILAGNLMFGFWLGALYSLIGTLLGSLFAFFIGKKVGRKFVDWVAGDKQTVDYYLDKIHGKENVVLFFMFLLPCFPDDALCAIAGITKMRTIPFFIMQVICRPVGIFGTLFFMSGEVIPWSGWGIAVIVVVAICAIVAFIFAFKYADKLNAFFDKFISKFNRKEK